MPGRDKSSCAGQGCSGLCSSHIPHDLSILARKESWGEPSPWPALATLMEWLRQRVAAPGQGLPPLCPWRGKGPEESGDLQIPPPGLSPASPGACGPRGGIAPWTARPGVPGGWLGLGHGYRMVPELMVPRCPGCPIAEMAFYCN